MKKAFTLIELLGVIIILAVVALITFPIIDNSIQKSRESALERTIENIERAAYSYSVEYDLGYPVEQQVLELSELISKGFITKEEHINPVTDKELQGCVLYNWNETKKQYYFEYVEPCKVEEVAPTMTLVYDKNYINENGWINRNIMVNINGTGSKYYYCVGNSECEPTIEENKSNGSQILTSEGTNVVCAKAVNSLGESEVVCTEELKIDKTKPTIGEITINGILGQNNWYTSNVNISVSDGSDTLSGYDKTVSSVENITSNTKGTMVYIVVTDLAGNSQTEAFNIKIDKDSPTIIAKEGTVEITVGDSNPVSNYFNVSYSISGGIVNCDPNNTSVLSEGNKTISCTVIGGNGLSNEASKEIKVKSTMYVDNSGANSPELLDNMIPVYYDGTNWIYADTKKEWYDYDKKEWANAVVLNSGVTKNVGDIVTEDEIALWYVWIPRYTYTIFNGNNESVAEQEIQIKFENGISSSGTIKCVDAVSGSGTSSETCTDTTNGSIKNGTSTYTHPAFTFGDKELTGFWVGKFEVSGSTSQITIKPNVSSLRNINISSFFNSIQNMSTIYSLNGDSHMIKNMEWGAVAYLSHSKYGTCTNGTCTEVSINSNNDFYTGGGISNAYKTNIVQSTTQNIYGIYDMSGAANEYVMGNMVDSNGNFYSSAAGFTKNPDLKYYNRYTYSTSYGQHELGKLGDCTKETVKTFGAYIGGWYGDYSSFLNATSSWFGRGGYRDGRSGAGIFNFNFINGSGGSSISSRAVLCK